MRGDIFTFGPFTLDVPARRLSRLGDVVVVGSRHFDLLHALVSRPGMIVSKDVLAQAAWPDVTVGENSLEKAVSRLRSILSEGIDGTSIETEPGRGYRFIVPAQRSSARESDATLDDLLAPHRAWLDGRAALETLERDQIVRARSVFEAVIAQVPEQASAHVGLANACAMQFEMTRTELVPDTASLQLALVHAREACRIDSQYGEAWATLGFVLQRAGREDDALAASRRAVSLEPDNWRHRLRLAYASWGEERLREARRTLTLLPGLPMAYWLIVTVLVARQAFDEAERELAAGLAAQAAAPAKRFTVVGLHWLSGLLLLANGRASDAGVEFEREIAQEAGGHLYARECSANAWYALGAIAMRQERWRDAVSAMAEALRRQPRHAGARAAAVLVRAQLPSGERSSVANDDSPLITPFDRVWTDALTWSLGGQPTRAAALLDQALALAPQGSVGWLLPLEPLLQVRREPEAWSAALSRLRNRAA